MPSPFPGMDPYLEAPDLWPDVHARLIAEIGGMLAGGIRPRYLTRIESRTVVPHDDEPGLFVMIPDVQVLLSAANAAANRSRPAADEEEGGGVATAVAGPATTTEPLDLTDILTDDIREPYLQVIHVGTRRLVTVIELVSPANKVRGSAARDSFLEKRDVCLASGVHWVEIDLLRGGERPTAAGAFADAAYRVHVHKFDPPARRGYRRLFWPVRLRDRLPTLGVPLLPEDGQAPLDLQAVLATTYDRAGYDLSIDYTRPPPGPEVTGDDAAWVLQQGRPAEA